MNTKIFREYDIRGIVKDDLTRETVTAIGRAMGTILKRAGKKSLAIGQDVRTTSPILAGYIADGANASGIDIIDIGAVPTPLLYFALHHLHPDGGIMITGSHNPPEYNGFKLCLGTSSLHGAEIQNLRKMIESKDFESGSGTRSKADVIEAYIKMVKENIRLNPARKLRIVVDSGNGCGSLLAPRLYRELGCEVTELFCEPDGTFPNHHPDPTVEKNLEDIIAKVAETKSDGGIAFDGDADRIGVVDEHGGIIWGDMQMMIYAREILSRKPGARIVFDVKCTQNLATDIKKHGGIPVMNATGHSLIKARLKKESAELAGEMSAHIFFKDRYFGYDDAIYTGARLLEIMSNSAVPLSGMLADVPKTYSTPELRVDASDEDKFDIVKSVTDYFRSKYEVIDIDGVRVNFPEGWGLIRASNTQPVLVLRVEANSQQKLDEYKGILFDKLGEYDSVRLPG